MSYKISHPPVLMDEKRPSIPSSRSRRRRYRWVAVLMMASLLLYMLYSAKAVAGWYMPVSPSSSSSQAPSASLPSETTTNTHGGPLVPLEIHIMSKCPDAQYCLSELVVPSMVRVSDKVDFTLSYIGALTANDGIECKHGPKECMGNIIELCAVHLYPDVKVHLGFTNCLTEDYPDIPDSELVGGCALEFGIDMAELNDCASRDNGAFGLSLLRQSVKRSAEANVTKSCTIRVNEEVYCIRDGRQWKDCPQGADVDTLVATIEGLYQTL